MSFNTFLGNGMAIPFFLLPPTLTMMHLRTMLNMYWTPPAHTIPSLNYLAIRTVANRTGARPRILEGLLNANRCPLIASVLSDIHDYDSSWRVGYFRSSYTSRLQEVISQVKCLWSVVLVFSVNTPCALCPWREYGMRRVGATHAFGESFITRLP